MGRTCDTEGFNNNSQQWYQMYQCPADVKGPSDWREFTCTLTIPKDTVMIRLALNAGSSTQPNQQSITWFDAISITSLNGGNLTRLAVKEGTEKAIPLTLLGKVLALLLASLNVDH